MPAGTGLRRLGRGSWYSIDAHIVDVSLHGGDWIAEYGDGVVVVESAAARTANAIFENFRARRDARHSAERILPRPARGRR